MASPQCSKEQEVSEKEPADISGGMKVDKGNDKQQTAFTRKLEICNVALSTFINQYMIIEDAGKGSFGKVKLCVSLDTTDLVAIKTVNNNSRKFRLQLLRKKVGKY